jgi:hypothetical protein
MYLFGKVIRKKKTQNTGTLKINKHSKYKNLLPAENHVPTASALFIPCQVTHMASSSSYQRDVKPLKIKY